MDNTIKTVKIIFKQASTTVLHPSLTTALATSITNLDSILNLQLRVSSSDLIVQPSWNRHTRTLGKRYVGDSYEKWRRLESSANPTDPTHWFDRLWHKAVTTSDQIFKLKRVVQVIQIDVISNHTDDTVLLSYHICVPI